MKTKSSSRVVPSSDDESEVPSAGSVSSESVGEATPPAEVMNKKSKKVETSEEDTRIAEGKLKLLEVIKDAVDDETDLLVKEEQDEEVNQKKKIKIEKNISRAPSSSVNWNGFNGFKSYLPRVITFVKEVVPGFDEVTWKILETTQFYRFIRMISNDAINDQVVKKSNKCIYDLCMRFSKEEEGFKIRSDKPVVKVSPELISLVFGIPLRGISNPSENSEKGSRGPFIERNFTKVTRVSTPHMISQIKVLMRKKNKTKEDKEDIVKLLIMYLLAAFFMAKSSQHLNMYTAHWFENMDYIKSISWPRYMAKFLNTSLKRHASDPKSLSGCYYLLQYLLVEHTNLIQKRNGLSLACPRMQRWDMAQIAEGNWEDTYKKFNALEVYPYIKAETREEVELLDDDNGQTENVDMETQSYTFQQIGKTDEIATQQSVMSKVTEKKNKKNVSWSDYVQETQQNYGEGNDGMGENVDIDARALECLVNIVSDELRREESKNQEGIVVKKDEHSIKDAPKFDILSVDFSSANVKDSELHTAEKENGLKKVEVSTAKDAMQTGDAGKNIEKEKTSEGHRVEMETGDAGESIEKENTSEVPRVGTENSNAATDMKGNNGSTEGNKDMKEHVSEGGSEKDKGEDDNDDEDDGSQKIEDDILINMISNLPEEGRWDRRIVISIVKRLKARVKFQDKQIERLQESKEKEKMSETIEKEIGMIVEYHNELGTIYLDDSDRIELDYTQFAHEKEEHIKFLEKENDQRWYEIKRLQQEHQALVKKYSFCKRLVDTSYRAQNYVEKQLRGYIVENVRLKELIRENVPGALNEEALKMEEDAAERNVANVEKDFADIAEAAFKELEKSEAPTYASNEEKKRLKVQVENLRDMKTNLVKDIDFLKRDIKNLEETRDGVMSLVKKQSDELDKILATIEAKNRQTNVTYELGNVDIKDKENLNEKIYDLESVLRSKDEVITNLLKVDNDKEAVMEDMKRQIEELKQTKRTGSEGEMDQNEKAVEAGEMGESREDLISHIMELEKKLRTETRIKYEFRVERNSWKKENKLREKYNELTKKIMDDKWKEIEQSIIKDTTDDTRVKEILLLRKDGEVKEAVITSLRADLEDYKRCKHDNELKDKLILKLKRKLNNVGVMNPTLLQTASPDGKLKQIGEIVTSETKEVNAEEINSKRAREDNEEEAEHLGKNKGYKRR